MDLGALLGLAVTSQFFVQKLCSVEKRCLVWAVGGLVGGLGWESGSVPTPLASELLCKYWKAGPSSHRSDICTSSLWLHIFKRASFSGKSAVKTKTQVAGEAESGFLALWQSGVCPGAVLRATSV